MPNTLTDKSVRNTERALSRVLFLSSIPFLGTGWNENTNRLIREYILKGTDFGKLTNEMLAEIEWNLTTGLVSNSDTGSLWNIVNYCLILIFEVCCPSQLNSKS